MYENFVRYILWLDLKFAARGVETVGATERVLEWSVIRSGGRAGRSGVAYQLPAAKALGMYYCTILLLSWRGTMGNNDSDDDERMVRTGMPLLVYIGAAWTPGEQFGSGVSPIASSTFWCPDDGSSAALELGKKSGRGSSACSWRFFRKKNVANLISFFLAFGFNKEGTQGVQTFD